jgi:hypothetical protein
MGPGRGLIFGERQKVGGPNIEGGGKPAPVTFKPFILRVVLQGVGR